jgi:hypothetical protein
MYSKLTVEMTAGMKPKECVDEAKRLSMLLKVIVAFEFNEVHVGVIGDRILYAINKDGFTSQWFLNAHNKETI